MSVGCGCLMYLSARSDMTVTQSHRGTEAVEGNRRGLSDMIKEQTCRKQKRVASQS